VADQLRSELALLLTREVHDPGIGFVTLTRVHVSPDLQSARVFFTSLGDEAARKSSALGLTRAVPFLRRQIGKRLRLKRVPEITFVYDESIAGQDRIEQLLNQLRTETPPPGVDSSVDHSVNPDANSDVSSDDDADAE
jgi:ribosome-binding factor A